ncbi:hypothetical protein ACFFX0_24555 [Citricoccus parietis]|uniref:Uncharacterized protein n=1 Tax=Citricoccus parietis TaxID=592307 RepID=A0ABV5G5H1_9MICC
MAALAASAARIRSITSRISDSFPCCSFAGCSFPCGVVSVMVSLDEVWSLG